MHWKKPRGGGKRQTLPHLGRPWKVRTIRNFIGNAIKSGKTPSGETIKLRTLQEIRNLNVKFMAGQFSEADIERAGQLMQELGFGP